MVRQQRKAPDGSGKLDELLKERRQLEAWLNKLDRDVDKTPDEIKDRVREDYQRRLLAILSQVQKFSDQLEKSLERVNKRRDSLLEEERTAHETWAEAELRYDVGEYEESEWEDLKAELTKITEQVARQLAECTTEINRLEEFLAGASDRPRRAKKQPKKAKKPQTGALRPRRSKKSPKEPEKEEPQTDAFEEEEAAEPEEDREPIEEAAEEPAEIRISATDLLSQDLEPATEEPHEEGHEEEPALPDRPSASISVPFESTADRPLKCADCGTMNLATEWYCESCGAELASL